MPSASLKRSRHELIATLVLVGLVFRGLIPAGFMPSSEHPLRLEICHDGFPVQLLAHHRHSGSQLHVEHCLFGAGSASGPALHIPLFVLQAPVARAPAPALARSPLPVQLVHLPQPRGPPHGA